MKSKIVMLLIVSMVSLFFGCDSEIGNNDNNLLPTFSIIYHANGGTGTVPLDTTNYEVGQLVTVKGIGTNFEKYGFSFNGWNTSADGKGTAYTAGSTFKMSDKDVTLYAIWINLPTYEIGKTGPSGVGIVFYVTDGGLHGLEVAPVDQSISAKWKLSNNSTPGTLTAIGTGSENTKKMAGELHPAAELCRTYTGGGKTDWFLPSKDELYTILNNWNIINDLGMHKLVFSDSYYWSSSEYNADMAWSMKFVPGELWNLCGKTLLKSVRAVRAF